MPQREMESLAVANTSTTTVGSVQSNDSDFATVEEVSIASQDANNGSSESTQNIIMTITEITRRTKEILPSCSFKMHGEIIDIVSIVIDSINCVDTHPVDDSEENRYSFNGTAMIKIRIGSDSLTRFFDYSGNITVDDEDIIIADPVCINAHYC